jgi:hypothetical protein
MRREGGSQVGQKRHAPRRGGTAPLACALLVGCLLSGCWGAASDSTSDASGSGGAAGGGVVGDSSGGTSASGGAGSGGVASAGNGGSGGTSGAGGRPSSGTMTQEEWEALTAPQSGPHEIWTRDTCEVPHVGSNSTRVGQEYSIVPSLSQTTPPDFDLYTNPVFLIDARPASCTTAAECTEEPNGLCMGAIAEPYCRYSEPPPREACDEAADCTAQQNGACEAPHGLEEYTICYPTGECHTPAGSCGYGTHPRCTSDADCTAGEGGKCIFPVTAGCNYDHCSEDGDCEGNLRCGCGRCLEAACASDDDCAEGETCEMSPPWCRGDYSFHCSTPSDTCTAGEPGCIYQVHDGDDYYWSSGRCAL